MHEPGAPAPHRPRRLPASAWTSVPVAVPARRVDDDAGGLVDDEQVLVLPEDLVRRRRAPPASGAAASALVDVDDLARPRLVALGPRRAVDAHVAGVDQALRPRVPRPQRPGQERVEALAGGLRRRDRSVRTPSLLSMTHSSSSTPNVIAMSATLNAGHAGSLMKSVTAPSRTRSMMLPIAPPSSIPVGSHTSGRSRCVTK